MAEHVAAKPAAYARLSVTDAGCGIDEATRAPVFEPLFTSLVCNVNVTYPRYRDFVEVNRLVSVQQKWVMLGVIAGQHFFEMLRGLFHSSPR